MIRASTTPSWLKNVWSEKIKKLKQKDSDRQRFVEELANVVNGQFDSNEWLSTLKIHRTVEDEDKAGEKGSWVSYQFLCDKEGKLVADELIRLKGIQSRPHKKLPPGHNVPWPHCCEWEWSKDIWSKLTVNKFGVSLDDETSGASEDVRQAFFAASSAATDAFADAASLAPTDSSNTTLMLPKNGVVDDTGIDEEEIQEKVAETFQNVNSAHSSWDRSTRAWKSTLLQSAKCTRTKDTQVHAELTEILTTGDETDRNLMGWESTFKGDGEITLANIQTVDSLCASLKEKRTKGNERAKLLVSWINVDKEKDESQKKRRRKT